MLGGGKIWEKIFEEQFCLSSTLRLSLYIILGGRTTGQCHSESGNMHNASVFKIKMAKKAKVLTLVLKERADAWCLPQIRATICETGRKRSATVG